MKVRCNCQNESDAATSLFSYTIYKKTRLDNYEYYIVSDFQFRGILYQAKKTFYKKILPQIQFQKQIILRERMFEFADSL